MEEVVKKTVTKKVEECAIECTSCGKKIVGYTEKQVRFLLMVHKNGSKCQK